MRTAFLGPRGTFSEDAARLHAGDGEMIDFSSVPALTAAVETGLATDAVLPIENSIEGAVSATLDLLIHETRLKIKAELVVPVRLFLITVPGANLSDIKVVTSHPNPLGQSRRFLERCLPKAEKVASLSTALAVEELVASGDRSRAAIGTEQSASLFGGEIIARDIQDVRSNVTRFVVVGPEDAAPTGNDKTSIGFILKANVPGALYKVLTPLAEQNIQMTKIENRPTKVWLGEYVFLIDFEGHRTDPGVVDALNQIREHCAQLKVFGSYPKFPLQTLEYLTENQSFPAPS